MEILLQMHSLGQQMWHFGRKKNFLKSHYTLDANVKRFEKVDMF